MLSQGPKGAMCHSSGTIWLQKLKLNQYCYAKTEIYVAKNRVIASLQE